MQVRNNGNFRDYPCVLKIRLLYSRLGNGFSLR